MKITSKNHVQAWKASGITQREYARQNGINPNTFAYWITQDRKQKQYLKHSFLELRPETRARQFTEAVPVYKSELQISLNLWFIRFVYRRSE